MYIYIPKLISLDSIEQTLRYGSERSREAFKQITLSRRRARCKEEHVQREGGAKFNW